MVFARADYSYKLNKDYTLLAGLKLFKQDDVGDALVGKISTYMAGGSIGLKAYGARLDLLYGQVGDDNLIAKWGSDKVITQQVYGIDKADQDSFGAKFSYDFGRLNIKGLSAYVFYCTYDTPESGVNASQDFDELDLNLQYKFGKPFKGLSLRLRHAIIDKDKGGEDLTDSRVYLQCKF